MVGSIVSRTILELTQVEQIYSNKATRVPVVHLHGCFSIFTIDGIISDTSISYFGLFQ